MDNNGCGFQISQIEDDFTSRNSITSLLDQAGSGSGQAAGGGGPIHHSFFDPLASYLENINPRDHHHHQQQQQQQGQGQGLLIRKSGQGLGDPQAADNSSINGANATSADRLLPAGGAPEYSNGSMEHGAWNSSNRGGGGGAGGGGGSSGSNGTSGRLSVEAAGGASKVGKKRSRASRRAPTTVLTTDTSNFRAMVQEFTGIPPAPFASATPFPRARLDFLGGPRSLANPFLLRPFPQRMAAGPGALSFPPSATNPNLQSFPQTPLFQSLLHPGGGNLVQKSSGGGPLSNMADAQMKAGLLEELGLNPHALPDLVPWHAGQENAAACKMSYSKSAGSGDPGRSRTLNLDDAIANASDHHNSNHGRPDRMVDSWISSSDQTLDKLVQ